MLFLLFGCTAGAQKVPISQQDGSMQISGKVAVVGNVPFTFLNLVTADKVEYRLVGALEEKIRREMQQMILTVEGRIVKKAIGPGFPAEFEVFEILKAGPESRTRFPIFAVSFVLFVPLMEAIGIDPSRIFDDL